MDFQKLAEMMKALGDPTRLKVLALLNVRDCCVCELVPLFGISQPAISKHMSRLKTAGLVTEKRRGQWVFYSLNRENLEAVGFAVTHLPDQTASIQELEERGLLVTCCE
ncbi:ArsR family transcriptional regulator [Tumebacillus sp. BK434]|uniref:ArsR/SmtB family transcription factor n=1 Tax=Tumebacillus sp. BK434 TaxID=2512169 RepID=UPI001043E00F|nr:metalloregulator ArsR/SmtB family transcription factor [Tumebacillus sp. BK434]TCP58139.1 ArsR family transcriptional regulator [Tumebacillus sp. BK434]